MLRSVRICATYSLLVLFACCSVFSPQPCSAADEWSHLTVPDAWRKVPGGELKPIDGFSWYRALVKVPTDWKGAKLRLYVEALDDARSTYVNGTRVGATGTFPPQFRSGLGEKGVYTVNSDLIKAGEFNAIAIRVFQNDPRPNFSVAPPVLLNPTQTKRFGWTVSGSTVPAIWPTGQSQHPKTSMSIFLRTSRKVS